MGSWNWPVLVNKISTDIPFISAALKALLKLDPTGIDDVPVDAKRLTETAVGQHQFQKFSGTAWSSVGKLMHDVDTVDGYHASQSANANTIAVRDANGNLAGDILGNSATATSAIALSVTCPVAKGGTGATSSAAARVNLDTPPTAHKSTATTYGVGDVDEYGHVKLSDAMNSTSGAVGGVAATPSAVKTAYDRASLGVTNAAAAQSTADTAVTKANAAQTSANNAQTTATAAKAVTDLVTDVPTAGGIPKAGANKKLPSGWIDIPAGKAIGEAFIYTGIDVPAGSLPCDGTQYTGFSTTYPDAYTWVTTKAKTKTLTEYTAIVNQYGECGYWGLDTATGTVRVPMIKSFIQGTTSVGDISKNVEAGLPNVTGVLTNPVYGKSDTVQPQAIKYRWFAQIYSSVLPASTADMANWNTQLDGRANTTLSNLEPAANNVIKSALNATGEAPIYACRAWVNFNGNGTVAIRESGNVSSITDNGTGDYTVNFTTAMPDVNFSAFVTSKPMDVGVAITTGRLGYYNNNTNPMTETSVRIISQASDGSYGDTSYVCVSIFR